MTSFQINNALSDLRSGDLTIQKLIETKKIHGGKVTRLAIMQDLREYMNNVNTQLGGGPINITSTDFFNTTGLVIPNNTTNIDNLQSLLSSDAFSGRDRTVAGTDTTDIERSLNFLMATYLQLVLSETQSAPLTGVTYDIEHSQYTKRIIYHSSLFNDEKELGVFAQATTHAVNIITPDPVAGVVASSSPINNNSLILPIECFIKMMIFLLDDTETKNDIRFLIADVVEYGFSVSRIDYTYTAGVAPAIPSIVMELNTASPTITYYVTNLLTNGMGNVFVGEGNTLEYGRPVSSVFRHINFLKNSVNKRNSGCVFWGNKVELFTPHLNRMDDLFRVLFGSITSSGNLPSTDQEFEDHFEDIKISMELYDSIFPRTTYQPGQPTRVELYSINYTIKNKVSMEQALLSFLLNRVSSLNLASPANSANIDVLVITQSGLYQIKTLAEALGINVRAINQTQVETQVQNARTDPQLIINAFNIITNVTETINTYLNGNAPDPFGSGGTIEYAIPISTLLAAIPSFDKNLYNKVTFWSTLEQNYIDRFTQLRHVDNTNVTNQGVPFVAPTTAGANMENISVMKQQLQLVNNVITSESVNNDLDNKLLPLDENKAGITRSLSDPYNEIALLIIRGNTSVIRETLVLLFHKYGFITDPDNLYIDNIKHVKTEPRLYDTAAVPSDNIYTTLANIANTLDTNISGLYSNIPAGSIPTNDIETTLGMPINSLITNISTVLNNLHGSTKTNGDLRINTVLGLIKLPIASKRGFEDSLPRIGTIENITLRVLYKELHNVDVTDTINMNDLTNVSEVNFSGAFNASLLSNHYTNGAQGVNYPAASLVYTGTIGANVGIAQEINLNTNINTNINDLVPMIQPFFTEYDGDLIRTIQGAIVDTTGASLNYGVIINTGLFNDVFADQPIEDIFDTINTNTTVDLTNTILVDNTNTINLAIESQEVMQSINMFNLNNATKFDIGTSSVQAGSDLALRLNSNEGIRTFPTTMGTQLNVRQTLAMYMAFLKLNNDAGNAIDFTKDTYLQNQTVQEFEHVLKCFGAGEQTINNTGLNAANNNLMNTVAMRYIMHVLGARLPNEPRLDNLWTAVKNVYGNTLTASIINSTVANYTTAVQNPNGGGVGVPTLEFTAANTPLLADLPTEQSNTIAFLSMNIANPAVDFRRIDNFLNKDTAMLYADVFVDADDTNNPVVAFNSRNYQSALPLSDAGGVVYSHIAVGYTSLSRTQSPELLEPSVLQKIRENTFRSLETAAVPGSLKDEAEHIAYYILRLNVLQDEADNVLPFNMNWGATPPVRSTTNRLPVNDTLGYSIVSKHMNGLKFSDTVTGTDDIRDILQSVDTVQLFSINGNLNPINHEISLLTFGSLKHKRQNDTLENILKAPLRDDILLTMKQTPTAPDIIRELNEIALDSMRFGDIEIIADLYNDYNSTIDMNGLREFARNTFIGNNNHDRSPDIDITTLSEQGVKHVVENFTYLIQELSDKYTDVISGPDTENIRAYILAAEIADSCDLITQDFGKLILAVLENFEKNILSDNDKVTLKASPWFYKLTFA